MDSAFRRDSEKFNPKYSIPEFSLCREKIIKPFNPEMLNNEKFMEEFKKTEEGKKLLKEGVVLSHICPLMYMNNPKCGTMPVITCSNKLRTYTSARFYKEDELLEIITGGDK